MQHNGTGARTDAQELEHEYYGGEEVPIRRRDEKRPEKLSEASRRETERKWQEDPYLSLSW